MNETDVNTDAEPDEFAAHYKYSTSDGLLRNRGGVIPDRAADAQPRTKSADGYADGSSQDKSPAQKKAVKLLGLINHNQIGYSFYSQASWPTEMSR
jgi:hypothetical protein